MKTLIASILLAFSCAAQAGTPALNSRYAAVYDMTNQQFVLEKNADTPAPMASITKVLTAMVALDAKPDMSETLTVTSNDVDTLKNSGSRVRVGTEMSRKDMLHLALMSSENRAASALSYNYPGGHDAFINAMNQKARSLGMTQTSVADSTGLNPRNHSTARDLVKMVMAADDYAPITRFTTTQGYDLPVGSRTLTYRNSNPLVGKPNWDIELSKTGFTREAGRCIVLKIAAAGKEYAVALMGSQSSGARLADIQAIKRFVSGQDEIITAAQPAKRPGLRLARKDSGKTLIAAKKSGFQNAVLDVSPRGKAKALRVKLAKKAPKAKMALVKLEKKEPKAKMVRVKLEEKKQKGKSQRV